MEIRNLTRITFDPTEARHVAAVLTQQTGLIPELVLLRDAINEELFAHSIGAVDFDEIDTDVTLPFDVLQALAIIFSKRTRREDLALDLSPELGYKIAEGLVLTYTKARRYDAFPTPSEVNDVAALFNAIAGAAA